ncbi:MAG: nickel-type superoxide dismutase maturation protease [Actinomycetota bacterium]|nr:nickel-type superoxide dismutase maturation protease [Actinomycetota bacterium]
MACPWLAASVPLVLVAGILMPLALRRVEVAGTSMAPGLLPGDRLAVLGRPAWAWGRLVRPGAVVVVRDPRRRERVLVKRVAGVSGAGVVVLGDRPEASTDSRDFGPVPRSDVVGVAVYRYGPSHRTGRLSRCAADVPG